ncbi:hypothetical protein HAX54_053495 [Datura stramonium]|uniref:Iron hydrogenase small subunit domain-containing protein n=1 Tax=Datura stramonium TaxID=4076 RepID=A0ABS8T145_DATST|nr:hypothetical protein [Datura stramonium]
MACPSGCLNGGGQIKPQPGQSAKELIQLLDMAYVENVVVADPFNSPIAKGLYSEWLEKPGSEETKRYLHTEYHPVVKSITSQLQNWSTDTLCLRSFQVKNETLRGILLYQIILLRQHLLEFNHIPPSIVDEVCNLTPIEVDTTPKFANLPLPVGCPTPETGASIIDLPLY